METYDSAWRFFVPLVWTPLFPQTCSSQPAAYRIFINGWTNLSEPLLSLGSFERKICNAQSNMSTPCFAKAINLAMMLLGRIIAGFSVGLLSGNAPVYTSEIAPPALRGALVTGFQFAITVSLQHWMDLIGHILGGPSSDVCWFMNPYYRYYIYIYMYIIYYHIYIYIYLP